jgi:hypothetical protein
MTKSRVSSVANLKRRMTNWTKRCICVTTVEKAAVESMVGEERMWGRRRCGANHVGGICSGEVRRSERRRGAIAAEGGDAAEEQMGNCAVGGGDEGPLLEWIAGENLRCLRSEGDWNNEMSKEITLFLCYCSSVEEGNRARLGMGIYTT